MTDAAPPPSKPFYLSKTFWTNAAALAATALPAVREWLAANPVEFVAALGALNLLLRFVTSGKLSMTGEKGTPGGGTPAFLVALAAGALSCGLLPSCVAGYGPDGTWSFRADPKVIDGALEYLLKEDAKGYTYYDAETGAVILPEDYAAYGIEP